MDSQPPTHPYTEMRKQAWLDTKNIFTARVRSTREGKIYTVCSHCGGGGRYPIPGLARRGIPISGRGGCLGYSVPPQTWDGVTPPPQHSEHLICGRRYASCIHAGGLFLFSSNFKISRVKEYFVANGLLLSYHGPLLLIFKVLKLQPKGTPNYKFLFIKS